MFPIRCVIFSCFTLLSSLVVAAPVTEFLPTNIHYNKKIPTPKTSLGFELGQRHIRHDQLKSYFYQLQAQSNRVKITTIGHTPQQREQFLVTISSAENLSKLPELMAKNSLSSSNPNPPLVIWLGYSVHGDEISGANAALAVAYYLAASEEQSLKNILANTIIVLEPSINPDGMDRFVNWVSTYRNSSHNGDANHIEHNQGWVTGRTNHFWFDLNRDWLLLSQQETQHRLKYYHQYKPHVVGDFHEMGANSSYFFQPGIKSRTHPLTPRENGELTSEIAQFHARALDKQQQLYYSEEHFDDFYHGKGSTYPDINGAIGILFEQASSRGMRQETINGLLTFEHSIKNHITTSLSTINGAWQKRDKLHRYRQDFFQQGLKLAKKEKFNGYLIHESRDQYRLNAFLAKLTQHQIQVYPLAEDLEHEGKVYNKEHSYYLPLAQPQYRLIKTLFNQQTHFKDNSFYDVSGWTLPLAMNIEFHPLNNSWGLAVKTRAWTEQHATPAAQTVRNSYAYSFGWHHYLAPKLLNELLTNEIKVKVATKPFSSLVDGKLRHFSTGTILVLAGIQQKDNWQETLLLASNKVGIELVSLTSGLTPSGIDLGSSSFKLLTKPNVLLLGGEGISQYEAGEIRFYLDETLNIPVSIINHNRLEQVDLSRYSHILLVNGNYGKVAKTLSKKLQRWVKRGGVVFGQKRAAKWLGDEEILSVTFASKKEISQLFSHDNLNYKDRAKLASRKRIAGAIFQTRLDISHPLAYGYHQQYLPLFRNSTLIMEQPNQPFITLAQYTPKPLLSGFTDNNLTNRLAHNAAIVAHNYGQGRVIASTEVLAFRGYWHGSAKLLANSIFFGKVFSSLAK